jgi:hypothetical protein
LEDAVNRCGQLDQFVNGGIALAGAQFLVLAPPFKFVQDRVLAFFHPVIAEDNYKHEPRAHGWQGKASNEG